MNHQVPPDAGSATFALVPFNGHAVSHDMLVGLPLVSTIASELVYELGTGCNSLREFPWYMSIWHG